MGCVGAQSMDAICRAVKRLHTSSSTLSPEDVRALHVVGLLDESTMSVYSFMVLLCWPGPSVQAAFVQPWLHDEGMGSVSAAGV